MTTNGPRDDLLVGDHYYILASNVAADLPKLVLKHDDAFLVADRRGDFPGLAESEFGFYADGTRFLSQLELRVAVRRPLLLNATVSEDALQAAIELTNPDVLEGERRRDRRLLPGLALRMSRRLTLYRNQVYQALIVESFAREPHELEFEWLSAADFIDVFEARGHRRARRGLSLPPRCEPMTLTYAYRGLDDVTRTTQLEFFPRPEQVDPSRARYAVSLPPGARVELAVVVTAAVGAGPRYTSLAWDDAAARRRVVVEGLRRDAAWFETDHSLFNGWGERARSDLYMLLTETPDGFIAYAGIPWYVAPFGRDSLITALQVLPFDPELAKGTLRFSRATRAHGMIRSPIRNPARSSTSIGAARWPLAARSRSSRTMAVWTRRPSS